MTFRLWRCFCRKAPLMHCSFHVWFKYVMQLRNLHLREEREFLGSLRFRWEHQYRAGNTLAMMIFLIDFLMKHCNVSSRRCHALYLKSQFTIHVLKRNSWLVWPEQWWQGQSFSYWTQHQWTNSNRLCTCDISRFWTTHIVCWPLSRMVFVHRW